MENKKFHKAIKQFTQQKRHQEKRENMNAINILKDKIKSGANVGDKEFNSIMMSSGSKMGLDPRKGEKTKSKQTVIGQIKGQKPLKEMPNFAKAKRGESGRVGGGRFNRELAFERHEKTGSKNGYKDKKGSKGGFAGKKTGGKPQKGGRKQRR